MGQAPGRYGMADRGPPTTTDSATVRMGAKVCRVSVMNAARTCPRCASRQRDRAFCGACGQDMRVVSVPAQVPSASAKGLDNKTMLGVAPADLAAAISAARAAAPFRLRPQVMGERPAAPVAADRDGAVGTSTPTATVAMGAVTPDSVRSSLRTPHFRSTVEGRDEPTMLDDDACARAVRLAPPTQPGAAASPAASRGGPCPARSPTRRACRAAARWPVRRRARSLQTQRTMPERRRRALPAEGSSTPLSRLQVRR